MSTGIFGDLTALDARRHIDELQSLRGIAALIVAISHTSSIYALPSAARIAIDAVCNAHAWLIVFFVLSGYVLTGSLQRRGLSWKSVEGFYIGRLFRLFPALWVASAIAALFLFLFPPVVDPSSAYLLVRPVSLSFSFRDAADFVGAGNRQVAHYACVDYLY